MSNDVSDTAKKPVHGWPGLKNETPAAEPAPLSATAAATAAAPQEFQFVLESRLVAEHPPQTSDGSIADGLSPSRYEHGLWRAGWTDGRLGQTPDPQIQLVVSQGALTRSVRKAEAGRKLADAEAEEKHKRFIAEQRSREWKDRAEEHDRVVGDRRRNAVAYSRAMAVVYLFFGILIFIADLPLSFKVAPVLGVDLRRKTADGRAVSADNLDQLFADFGALWEPLAVAVGIAALTIAFKMLIDKLHRPYKFDTWWTRLLLGAMLLGTIGVSVYAFILIGEARAANTGVGSANNKLLFTMLAIVFPIVAGYCFSMARTAWQNVASFREVTRAYEAAWDAARDANLAAERAAAATATARAEAEAVEKSTVEEDFLKNLYLHGYQRGRCVPETVGQDASLYERCEALMIHWIGQLPQVTHEAAERRA